MMTRWSLARATSRAGLVELGAPGEIAESFILRFLRTIVTGHSSYLYQGEDTLQPSQRVGVTLDLYAVSGSAPGKFDEALSIGDDPDHGVLAGTAGCDVDRAVVYSNANPFAIHLDVVGLVEANRGIRMERHLKAEQQGAVR